MARRLSIAFLALLVVAAGCVGIGSSPPADGEGREATVTDVIDGDTVDVRFADGTTDRVRLLGVDSPEVGGGDDPAEFEGVPDTEAGRRCLLQAATRATDFTERHVAGRTVQVVTDPVADRRGDYGRLLAYLVLENGTNLNYRLVETGNARVYDSTFGRSDRFYAAEARAQEARSGLWACRDPEAAGLGGSGPLRVASIHPDAAGDDRENLGDEYVVFRNAGDETLDLGGWVVSDEVGHAYTVPDGFTLAPGESVTLYTGSGSDRADSLYWGSNEPVWNNAGDTVIVTNETGAVVVSYGY